MKKNVRKNAGILVIMAALCGVSTALAQTPDLLVCSDRGYTLNSKATAEATGATTYTWYENNVPVENSNTATLVISAGTKAAGSYAYVRKAGSVECPEGVESNTFTVRVLQQPAVPAITAVTPAVCEGLDVTFAIAPADNTTYTWTSVTGTETGTPSGDNNHSTYTLASPEYGTKEVQATASIFYEYGTKTKTCVSTTASQSAVVNPLPVVTPTAADFARCGKGELPLSVTVTAGGSEVTGTATISWYNESAGTSTALLSGVGSATYSPTLTATTPYWVGAVTAANCPSADLEPVTATISVYQGEIEGAEI